MRTPFYVYSFGMSCPVGRRAAAACAAMRAGIDRRVELPYLDEFKRTIVGSRAGFIEAVGCIDRITALLLDAIDDALDGQRHWLSKVPVVFALPEAVVPSRAEASRWIEVITERLAVKIDSSRAFVISGDRAAAFEALLFARELTRQHPAVVVCAVDSLVCAEPLLTLIERRRLLTESNSDGVVPGEAAVCVVLGSQPARARAEIQGIGVAEEPATIFNDVPLRGEGLCRAARAALREADVSMHHVDFRVSDAAGESYSFKEQALVVARLLRKPKADFPLWLAASELGDTGVAAGLVGTVMAVRAFEAGYAPGDTALVFAGGPGAKRTALVCSRRRALVRARS